MSQPVLRNVDPKLIIRSRVNPRSASTAASLAGLAASMGEDGKRIAEPLILRERGEKFDLIAGERRLDAALQRKAQTVPCMVHAELSELDAFRLRAVENLHREELSPIDLAILLKVEWYSDNLEASEKTARVEKEMRAADSMSDLLSRLEAALEETGFTPTAPAVTWDQTLNRLGIALEVSKRKRLMRTLNVHKDLHEAVHVLGFSEAQIRSLGMLAPTDQKRLVREVKSTPTIARNVRYIARSVVDGVNTMDEALMISRGGNAPEFRNEYAASETRRGVEEPAARKDGELDSAVYTEPIIALLEASNQMHTAFELLTKALTYGDLPDYWKKNVRTSVDLMAGVFASAEKWMPPAASSKTEAKAKQ